MDDSEKCLLFGQCPRVAKRLYRCAIIGFILTVALFVFDSAFWLCFADISISILVIGVLLSRKVNGYSLFWAMPQCPEKAEELAQKIENGSLQITQAQAVGADLIPIALLAASTTVLFERISWVIPFGITPQWCLDIYSCALIVWSSHWLVLTSYPIYIIDGLRPPGVLAEGMRLLPIEKIVPLFLIGIAGWGIGAWILVGDLHLEFIRFCVTVVPVTLWVFRRYARYRP
jgi:hypothetical protein